MANGYTAVPAVIPGPLQVNGQLTINSDQGIKLGGSSPFVRLFKRTAGGVGLSYNMASDEITRDATTAPFLAQLWESLLPKMGTKFVNASGVQTFGALDMTLAQDFAGIVNTGNVTENTTRSKVIAGNTLGADGSFVLDWLLQGTAQGASATTFRMRLGGVQILSFTRATIVNVLVRLVRVQPNGTGAAIWYMHVADSAGVFSMQVGSDARDMTVDQTIALSIQNGASTDSWSDQGWHIRTEVSTPGPI